MGFAAGGSKKLPPPPKVDAEGWRRDAPLLRLPNGSGFACCAGGDAPKLRLLNASLRPALEGGTP